MHSRADVRQEQVQQALVAADAGATAVPGPVSCPGEMEDFERGIFAHCSYYLLDGEKQSQGSEKYQVKVRYG